MDVPVPSDDGLRVVVKPITMDAELNVTVAPRSIVQIMESASLNDLLLTLSRSRSPWQTAVLSSIIAQLETQVCDKVVQEHKEASRTGTQALPKMLHGPSGRARRVDAATKLFLATQRDGSLRSKLVMSDSDKLAIHHTWGTKLVQTSLTLFDKKVKHAVDRSLQGSAPRLALCTDGCSLSGEETTVTIMFLHNQDKLMYLTNMVWPACLQHATPLRVAMSVG